MLRTLQAVAFRAGLNCGECITKRDTSECHLSMMGGLSDLAGDPRLQSSLVIGFYAAGSANSSLDTLAHNGELSKDNRRRIGFRWCTLCHRVTILLPNFGVL